MSIDWKTKFIYNILDSYPLTAKPPPEGNNIRYTPWVSIDGNSCLKKMREMQVTP